MNKEDELSHFSDALAQLEAALPQIGRDSLSRDGAIQRFEFTFETAWKALRYVLHEAHGIVANSPKAALRDGYANGLVADEAAWIGMLKDCNLATHTYDEALAFELASRLPEHALRLRELLEMLKRTR